MPTRTVRCVLCCCFWLINGVATINAQEAAPATSVYLPAPTVAQQDLLSLFSAPTQVSFVDLPLRDAMAFFGDFHKANVVLDRAALNDVGIAEDTLVNLELSDVSLRTALKLLLDPLNLVCVVQEEVLLVTTREKVETTFLTRVYPVADLAESAEELEILARTVEAGTNGQWVKVIPTGMPAQQVAHGGGISVVPRVRSLVIKQSLLVHDEIVELLTQLREAQALLPE